MTDHPLSTPMQRRTVLAAAAATGVLAACGSSDDNGTSDDATAPSDGQGSASGEVLADVADVPVEGGTVNGDAGVVVTQPAEGDYRAFTSKCPHQGCDVNRVDNNVIICPCHGSRFSAETGDVESGPAPRGLAEIDVVVEGESIVRA
jgi:Rieske Fe-S protein